MITVSTSGEKVLELLLEGALSFTVSAKKHALLGNTEKRVLYINKTCSIFNDLILSLQYNRDSEMSEYLYELYLSQLRLLSEANIDNDTSKLELVVANIKDMLSQWKSGLEEDFEDKEVIEEIELANENENEVAKKATNE